MNPRTISLVVFAAALAFAPGVSAQQNTVVACPDPQTCLPPTFALEVLSLEDAIKKALDPNNTINTVLVFEGEYDLDDMLAQSLNQKITIRGVGAPQNTIINATGSNAVFTIDADDVTIEAVTLKGARNGVWVMGGADIVLNRVYFLENTQNGVLIDLNSSVIVVNSSIAKNGTGIRVQSGGEVRIVSSTILGNTPGEGIRVEMDAVDTQIHNCIVAQNEGIGIFAQKTVTNSGTYVIDNMGGTGGDCTPASNWTSGMLDPDPTCNPGDPPEFATEPDWEGQIDPVNPNDSSVIDKGLTFDDLIAILPGREELIRIDFDGEARPLSGATGTFDTIGMSFDIGADEVNPIGGGTFTWSFVSIEPRIIGAYPPGSILVQFRLGGSADSVFLDANDPNYGGSDKVLLVPQLVEPIFNCGMANLSAVTIPINVRRTGGDFWIGTNAFAIESRVVNAGSGRRIVFDGTAMLHICQNGNDTLPLPTITADDRSAMVDTIPPRMMLELSSNFGNVDIGVEANELVGSVEPSNDLLTPQTVLAAFPGSALHNFPAFPTSINVWRPGATPEPYSTREIDYNPAEDGAQIFFNRGNVDVFGPIPSSLTVGVRVDYVDPRPENVYPAVPNIEFIEFIEPAGFANVSTGGNKTMASVRGLNRGLTDFFDPIWRVEAPGDQILTRFGATAQAMFATSNFEALASIQDHLAAEWRVTLARAAMNTDPAHIPVRFAAVDAAGNVTRQDQLLDLLHIWWMVKAETQLSPFLNGEVDLPAFSWRLKRSESPGDAPGAEPRFALRLLANPNLPDGTVALNPNGPFRPVPNAGPFTANGWALPAWTTATSLSPTVFEEVRETLYDRWFVFVVIGADEAGNVEPWPGGFDAATQQPVGLFTTDGIDYFIAGGQVAGSNWQRFYMPAPGDVIDTGIRAAFWHDQAPFNGVADAGEDLFGEARIVPLPAKQFFDPLQGVATRRVDVEFKFKISAPTVDPNAPRSVDWSLQKNGRGLTNGRLLLDPGSSDTATLRLAATVFSDVDEFLGDPARRDPVAYVLTAQAVVGTGGVRDATPANYAFTVAPSVEGFVENRQSPDAQPVKIVESN